MRRAFPFFLTAFLVFGLAFSFKVATKSAKRKLAKHSNYRPIDTKEVKEDKRFLIIIPSYNNEAFVEKNLDSVFKQEYKNYRVIYIDDASSDNTYEKTYEAIKKYQAEDRVTLIRNPQNHKALYNIYYAVHSASNEEIVVLLDGDDWFSHTKVLSLLNQYYNDPAVWLTYGQYMTYPGYSKGLCRRPFFKSLQRGKVRSKEPFSKEGDWIYSHLRTFYAGLFKRIPLKDQLYQGSFYSSAWDLAIMMPMLEMAREHAVFIPDVLYIYNRETPLNDDKVRLEEQMRLNRHIRNLPTYAQLFEDPRAPVRYEQGVELLVSSKNRPLQLYAFLESCAKHVRHIDQITVSYEADTPAFQEGYATVATAFPKVHFQNKKISSSKMPYVILAEDTLILKEELDVIEAVQLLERTGALGFYFQMGLNIEHLPSDILPIGEEAFVWSFNGEGVWKNPSTKQMVLYRRKDLDKPQASIQGIGAFYKNSKAVEIPLHVTRYEEEKDVILYSEEELNSQFQNGYKMDLSLFEDLQNRTPSMEFYPRFIER